MRQNVRVQTLARSGKNVQRQLLENALANSQSVSQFALNPQNFGSGQAGAFGAIAQAITAGVGAYSQYKAQQELAQLNSEDADAFAEFATTKGNPELAKVASRLSPESREAYYLSMALPSWQSSDIPAAVREFEYFKNLPPQIQNQYLGLKRNIAGEGGVVRDTGDIETLRNYGVAGAQRKGMEQTAKNISDLDYKPSIAGASSFAKNKAEEDVKAQESQLKIEGQIKTLDNTLSALESAPGMPDIFGAKGGGALLSYLGKKEPIAGSNASNAKAILDQIKGQQFLQAFESLKGGGQISEKEGEAATKALSAINENISEKELLKNIGILRGALNRAKQRATLRASQGYQRANIQAGAKSYLLDNTNLDIGNMGLDINSLVGNAPAQRQQKSKGNIKFLGFE